MIIRVTRKGKPGYSYKTGKFVGENECGITYTEKKALSGLNNQGLFNVGMCIAFLGCLGCASDGV